MWKNTVAHCKVGLKKCWSKIKYFVTLQGYRFEYLNMMAVVKLPVNSHALISLYQLYSHICWSLGKDYQSLYEQWYVDMCGGLENYVFVFDWLTR